MGFRYRRRLSYLMLIVLALALPIIEPYMPIVSASHVTVFFSSNAQGGFEPTGIDFGARMNVPGQLNEPRMLITRPWDGNPRQLVQRDADAASFSLRATLPNRPANNVKFVDAVAAIPAVVGTQSAQTTPGGFTPNDILVTQGFNVYLVSGAGTVPPAVTPTFLTTLPGSTQCTSTTSDILVDRWDLQFGGAAIVTCYRPAAAGVDPVFEVWTFTMNGTTVVGPTLKSTLYEQITGRASITSPNFSGCGGCLAVSPDNTAEVILIPGSGVPLSPRISLGSAATGRRLMVTVPSLVYEFGTSNGCLFGTVPSQNAIKMFDCTTYPAVFASTSPGDSLVFASNGDVFRVPASNPSSGGSVVDSGVGTYEDLAFTTVRLVQKIVQQPAVPNDNKGVQGNIVFYIESAIGFNPQADVNISTLRFGATGSEPSVNGNCNANVGTDVNGDGVPDLKCFADPAIAQCGGLVLCIVTGFTYNQVGFDD